MAENPASDADDWRKPVTLPDGRIVEPVDATWGTDKPDDPPGVVPVDVTVSVDGILQTIRVVIPDAQVIAALDRDRGGSR